MRLRFLLVVIACFVIAASLASAQTTGEVSGVVRDRDGLPLPGATVTITGPQLLIGRSTTTLSDGAFRFLRLVPGNYHLKAELSGMGAFDQDVVVALGKTTEVRPVLQLTAKAAVEVTAALPLVDTKSTEIAKVTTKETIEKLPLTRTFTGMFQLAPGVAENNSTAPNAGGGRQDNTFLYDGVNITNPFFGDLYQDFAELDIREVNITRGGITAEFGRTGGFIVNGVTKSGTNDFHGEARVEYEPSSFSAGSKDPTLTRKFNRVRPGADIGGPILKDQLFFYGSVNLFRQTEKDRVNRLGDIPDSATDINEYFGKLTAMPLSNHLIDGSFRYRGIKQDNADIFSSTAPSAGNIPKTIDRVGVLSWFWTATSSLSVEAKYNHNENNNSVEPITRLSYQPPFDPQRPYLVGSFITGKSSTTGQTFIFPPATSTGQRIGGAALAQNDQNFFRDEYRFQGSYLANFVGATHDIRAGVTYSINKEDLTRTANGWGTITVNDSSGCGPVSQRPCFRAVYSPRQPTQISRGRTLGLFLQDQASWKRLTLNVGVLLNRDTYIPNDNAEFTFLRGDFRVPNAQIKPCSDPAANPNACTYTDRLTFNFSKQVQPRVGLAYEIDTNVHDKAYLNYGRYDNLDNQSIARAAAPFRLVTSTAFFNATTGALISDTVRPNQTGKKVLPNIDPTYTDEYIGGYARPLGGGWSAELWGMYRKTQDIIEDFAATGNNFTEQNPGNFRYGNIPGVRRYKAGTIEVRKAYSPKWTLDVSYTLSRLSGNWDLDYATSLFYASSYIQDGPGLNTTDPTRNGILIGDRTHVAKVFATYELPTNTQLGGYLRFQSGRPWEARGFDPVYGTDYLYLEPAGSRRLSSWTNFDFLVAQRIPVGPGNLRLEARLLNVFNTQPALTVNPDYCNTTSNCYQTDVLSRPPTNPDFGRPTSYAPARRFLLTGIFSF